MKLKEVPVPDFLIKTDNARAAVFFLIARKMEMRFLIFFKCKLRLEITRSIDSRHFRDDFHGSQDEWMNRDRSALDESLLVVASEKISFRICTLSTVCYRCCNAASSGFQWWFTPRRVWEIDLPGNVRCFIESDQFEMFDSPRNFAPRSDFRQLKKPWGEEKPMPI